MPADTANTPPPVETAPDDPDDPASGLGWGTAGNAIVGAIVGSLLTFVPGSPFVGGAVAGYLEGGELEDGLRVGALVGLAMIVPILFFGLFAGALVFGVVVPGTTGALLLVLLALVALYTFGLGVVGAIVGREFKNEL